jgi:ketosteroid isomerase-like protein
MTPEEFPALFAAGWLLPKPEPFLAHFLPMIAADATFTQPSEPEACGYAEIERLFRRVFALIPDLVARPQRSAVNADTVFIESECDGTLANTPIHFSACDRFVIRDAKIVERRSYMDPTAILGVVIRRPSSWPRAIRARRLP